MIGYHQLQLVSSCNWRRRNLPKSILSWQCWYSAGSASTGISAVTWSLLDCLNYSMYIPITRKCSPFRAHKEGAWLIQKTQTFPYWSSPDFSALAELTDWKYSCECTQYKQRRVPAAQKLLVLLWEHSVQMTVRLCRLFPSERFVIWWLCSNVSREGAVSDHKSLGQVKLHGHSSWNNMI